MSSMVISSVVCSQISVGRVGWGIFLHRQQQGRGELKEARAGVQTSGLIPIVWSAV
jgi:hypothetical protein